MGVILLVALLRLIYGKRNKLYKVSSFDILMSGSLLHYREVYNDVDGKRRIMGDIGFIFGYTIVGAFLLGAVVGYIVEKIGDRLCDKEH